MDAFILLMLCTTAALCLGVGIAIGWSMRADHDVAGGVDDYTAYRRDLSMATGCYVGRDSPRLISRPQSAGASTNRALPPPPANPTAGATPCR